MKTKEIKKEFARFLKKHRAFKHYYKNRHDPKLSLKGLTIDFNNPGTLFCMAFNWADSPQGAKRWVKLDCLWEDYCKERGFM